MAVDKSGPDDDRLRAGVNADRRRHARRRHADGRCPQKWFGPDLTQATPSAQAEPQRRASSGASDADAPSLDSGGGGSWHRRTSPTRRSSPAARTPSSSHRAVAGARPARLPPDLRPHLARPRRRPRRSRSPRPAGSTPPSSRSGRRSSWAASRSRSPSRSARSSSPRCSRSSARSAGCRGTPPIYAIATLYVSLVRGTPLIVQLFVHLLRRCPQFGIVLPAVRRRRSSALVVQLRRLHDRDLPRRHPGRSRGARWRRPQALGMTERLDDAPDRAAAGDPDRHPGDRQRVHRDDQGLGAGVVRRPARGLLLARARVGLGQLPELLER